MMFYFQDTDKIYEPTGRWNSWQSLQSTKQSHVSAGPAPDWSFAAATLPSRLIGRNPEVFAPTQCIVGNGGGSSTLVEGVVVGVRGLRRVSVFNFRQWEGDLRWEPRPCVGVWMRGEESSDSESGRMEESSVRRSLETLCQELNMDEQTAAEAMDNFTAIWNTYSLEVSQSARFLLNQAACC